MLRRDLPGIESMNLKVRVMTHTIPDAFGIAGWAMVVLTVKQSMLVTDGLLQRYPSITVCTCDILNTIFFHHLDQ